MYKNYSYLNENNIDNIGVGAPYNKTIITEYGKYKC